MKNSLAAIGTLTMNPALDIATATDKVVPTHKLRCARPRYDPGGGGINVARVVRTLGGSATAIYPAGGTSGQMLRALLDGHDIPQRVVPIEGRTRESLTVDDRSSGEQFRFVMPGPDLSADEQQHCLDAIAELAPPPGILVASGSLPPDLAPDFYARVARKAREVGARMVLDTSGDALSQAASEGVWLIKPNLRELCQLAGRDLSGERDQVAAARQMLEEGRAEVIVVSLGADGALLVTPDAAEHIAPIPVPVRSAVGAGDSMVGGIVFALARGDTMEQAVRLGMAAGAATIMTEGTELCRREDVERLYDLS